MIPREKALVERLKDKPFAIIGINSDGNREALQKIIKENGINWRNAVDGSSRGPIETKWDVHGWPSMYLIDAKGVIRSQYFNLDEREINTLIKEAESGK